MTLFARRSSWRRRFTSFAPERSFCPRIFVRRFMKNSVPNQKKKGHLEAAFEIRPRGFEPLTFGSGDQRSIQTELRARKDDSTLSKSVSAAHFDTAIQQNLKTQRCCGICKVD